MKQKVIEELNKIKKDISQQTYRTIMGQINAGDIDGAGVGVQRLQMKIAKEKYDGE